MAALESRAKVEGVDTLAIADELVDLVKELEGEQFDMKRAPEQFDEKAVAHMHALERAKALLQQSVGK